jgi:hypothetical protein
MSFLSKILLAAFWLCSIAVANPVSAREQTSGRTLSLPVGRHIDRARNGPLDYYKTLQKHNIEIPEALENVLQTQGAMVQANAKDSTCFASILLFSAAKSSHLRD